MRYIYIYELCGLEVAQVFEPQTGGGDMYDISRDGGRYFGPQHSGATPRLHGLGEKLGDRRGLGSSASNEPVG